MSSADNFCKQFGPRSKIRPNKMSSLIGSKLFDTLMVFLEEFFEKADFEKKLANGKKSMQNYPVGKELTVLSI